MTRYVPVLPDNAPFSPEQRAYLNGFLAGLFSFSPIPGADSVASTPPSTALKPLTILFGSQTGTAEKLARRAAREAGRRGFAPTVHDLSQYPREHLTSEESLLVITSTYGDGEPPDNARAFWNWLKSDAAPRLDKTGFSVCALGDMQYTRFCQFGRDVDARLEELGARRLCVRQDCDLELERQFQAWLTGALVAFGSGTDSVRASTSSAAPAATEEDPSEAEPQGSRDRPLTARLKTNRRLSGPSSAKDVRHIEIALDDSGLIYQAGDALGVWPANCPELVDAILAALGCDGEEAVPGRDGVDVPLRLALLNHYEIGRIPRPLLDLYRASDSIREAASEHAPPRPAPNHPLFADGGDLLDLLQAHPGILPSVRDIVGGLRKLQPRLYSIASSPILHPAEVHLTVSAVRFHANGRSRRGVASCFLADRCPSDGPLPVFVHPNPGFRPPPPETPLIMIGPGTGIAPFRAFLQERRALGARDSAWLFFGDHHADADFLYADELAAFRADGVLARLDLAWSRDQGAKVYVQHRMLESAPEIWRWLELGAAIYVCGDAARMARDVDATLHQIVQQAGGMTSERAGEYVQGLCAARRYARDVY